MTTMIAQPTPPSSEPTDAAIVRLKTALEALETTDEPAYSVVFARLVELERWRRAADAAEVAAMSPTALWSRIEMGRREMSAFDATDQRVRRVLAALDGEPLR